MYLQNNIVVIEYVVPSTRKLYRHKMRLPMISPSSDINQITAELYKKHGAYLNHSKIAKETVESMN